MPKYEYKTVQQNWGDRIDDILNQYGPDGWELVHYQPATSVPARRKEGSYVEEPLPGTPIGWCIYMRNIHALTQEQHDKRWRDINAAAKKLDNES